MIQPVKSLKTTEKKFEPPSEVIEKNSELKALFEEAQVRINTLHTSSIINRAEPARLIQVIPKFPKKDTSG